MKNVAITLLLCYPLLDSYSAKINKIIVNYAVKSHNKCGADNTYRQVEHILALKQKVNELGFIKNLVDEQLNLMGKNCSLALKDKFIAGLDSKTASDRLKVSSRSYWRRLDDAIDNFTAKISRYLTVEEFLTTFAAQPWIMERYKKVVAKSIQKEKVDAEPEIAFPQAVIEENAYRQNLSE